jgi:hypothetical protein
MLTWKTTYYKEKNNNIKLDITNLIKIIKKPKKNEETVVKKINIIEEKYLEKIKNIEKICNIENLEEFKNKNSLDILKLENEIIFLLNKYSLQNNYLNYEFFFNCINFLYNLSEILRERINQNKINHNIKSNKNIPRCSYKFCNYKDSCSYHYKKKESFCYQDHYVHNMVSADLYILINYIKNNFKEKKLILHNKEILRSINTLSFVINHMFSELKTKSLYYNNDECENYHFIRKKNNKNNKKKRRNKRKPKNKQVEI